MRLKLTLLALLLSVRAFAIGLPGSLSGEDINRVTGILGPGSASKLGRSAEIYALWPGIKLGVEMGFFPSEEINILGDRSGTLPSLNPLPRLYLAKGILPGLEVILNYLPDSVENLIVTYGGVVKWSFVKEKDSWVEGALYGGYTRVSAYNADFVGDTFEAGITFSRDYVRLKPYLGAGLMFTSGNVATRLSSTGKTEGSSANVHFFTGAEIETPMNVGIQLDLINLSPGTVAVASSVFLGKKF